MIPMEKVRQEIGEKCCLSLRESRVLSRSEEATLPPQPRRGVVKKSAGTKLQRAIGEEFTTSDPATFSPRFFSGYKKG